MAHEEISDIFVDFLYKAVKDKFLQIVDEREGEIRQLFKEEFDEEVLRDHIKDFINYDDDLSESINMMVGDIVREKLNELLLGKSIEEIQDVVADR